MDEYAQMLEMQLRFKEEECQEREILAYQQGRADAINECIEALGNNIWDIAKLEQLKSQKT